MSRKYCKKEEPVLPRKALLNILCERAEVTNLIQDRPYTCITVRSWYNGNEYIGFGFSKVMYPDYWEGETGAEIAFNRAIIKIMRQVRSNEKKKRREEAWNFALKDAEKDLVMVSA